MKNFLLLVFTVLTVTGASLAQSEEKSKQYQGHILVEAGSGCHGETIRTKEDYQRFQQRIPPILPSKRRPPEENPDPLRTTLPWEFTTEMVLLAVRSDTLSAVPELHNLIEDEEEIVVTFVLEPPPPEAYPYGWGVYRAIVVPRSDKKVRYRFIGDHGPQSP